MVLISKIITADNSESFLNEEVGECYHSIKGAAEEALQKYAIPCKIKELAKTGKIKILDVCFGIGYNSAMAISVALEENPQCEIEVVGLEYDSVIINKIQEVNPSISFYPHYKKLTPQKLEFRQGNVSVKVLLGDANETAKQLTENHFDAVFFDPFSPKTAPHMWQIPLFQEMWRVMKPTGILATYSCARMARDNMAKAGLMYDDGPIWGRRGPGTIATKWV
ncbi:MAG: MnmC family methyltransferase [Nanoarchaeota archaeon]|nr:MnmC family methyltransferase [Nanoarchaeota archaeon]